MTTLWTASVTGRSAAVARGDRVQDECENSDSYIGETLTVRKEVKRNAASEKGYGKADVVER